MSICLSSLVDEERWINEPCKISAWISWTRTCFSLQSLYYHQIQAKDPSLFIFFVVSVALVSSFFLARILLPAGPGPSMATKMKGIYKSFKYISQIFVVKEREMEIGYPTNVKHVAHIGWDGQTGSAPSWMNEFKAAPDFRSSIGNPVDSTPWTSQDYDQQMGHQPVSEMFKDIPTTDHPKVSKKQKRKKKSSTNSPKSSSTRSSRAAKTKATFSEMERSNMQM